MLIGNKELLDKYAFKHAGIKNALQHWINSVEEAEWNSHNELKQDFPSSDYVGNGRYVFNIQGNRYRLVVVAIFIKTYISVRFLGTHAEYDKIDCKTI
jgi:mRNA interferase HigB